jgi:hypothetical protein
MMDGWNNGWLIVSTDAISTFDIGRRYGSDVGIFDPGLRVVWEIGMVLELFEKLAYVWNIERCIQPV